MSIINKKKLKFLYLFILFSLLLIFAQKTNFFKNIYQLIVLSYNTRFIKFYKNVFYSGYCNKESHGYIADIAHRYQELNFNNEIPKITNYDITRRIPFWIFKQSNLKENDKYQIILNYNLLEEGLLENNSKYYDYKIIDNYKNNCFFLIKK